MEYWGVGDVIVGISEKIPDNLKKKLRQLEIHGGIETI